MKITVYSDGSSDGKTGGVGGWAFVILVDGVKVHEASGSEESATNNTMECRAALEGLKYATATYPNESIELISDSQLVLNYTNGKWKCKKLHLALLHSQLRKLHETGKVTTKWERGHIGEVNNCRCDELAKAARTDNEEKLS